MKILGFEIGEVKPRIELPSPSPCPPPHNIGLPVATERIVEVAASAILQDRIDHLTRTAHGVTQACGNQMNKLITDIRKHLGPDFVRPNNLKYRPADAKASWGCCYYAAEALYYLGARKEGFVPAYIYVGEMEGSIFSTHWILIRVDGRVLDPTADQFNVPPDYRNARLCGFQTKRPSARSAKLIKLVKKS